MQVRAKFRVDSVKEQAWGKPPGIVTKHWTIEMSPVVKDSDDPYSENTHFWEATPSGKLEISTNNPKAAEAFKPGAEFYVDFTPATA